MGYQRLKSDSFTAFGGINQKASQADLSVMEFLDISNMDFTAIGALQQRPGTATFPITPVLNATFVATQVIWSPAFYWAGSWNSSFIINSGPTFIGGPINSIYEFATLSGPSYLVFSSAGGFSYASSSTLGITFGIQSFTLNQLYYVHPNGNFNYLLDPGSGVVSSVDYPVNQNWSFAAFGNRLFFANGDHFYKWDGVENTTFLLPGIYQNPNLSSTWFSNGNLSSITAMVATTQNANSMSPSFIPNAFAFKYCLPPGAALSYSTSTGLVSSSFSSITYTYSIGYVNDRGFNGPVSAPITVSGIGSNSVVGLWNWNVVVSGLNYYGFTFPQGYGIGTSTVSGYFGITWGVFSQINIYRDNGPGTGRYLIRSANALYQNVQWTDSGYPTTNIPEPTCIFATLPPQYLEIFNNALFMAGFSQAPSTAQFSDIGQPESVQPGYNFDVRTNDGDFITGMKAAFGQLFFFKNKSFHALSGTDSANYSLNQISDQYGCISNRAVATYNNYLLFLDKKGICQFNGAIPQIISQKLDPIFANMNLSAAQNNAWMIHNKERNQIWTGIPVNGSTLINQIVVYDYLLNAWTHFDGLNAACAAMGFGGFQQRKVFFGSYTNVIGYFSPSLTSDFGNAITMMIKSRFISDMGQSVEKMWRRLFINQLSSIGATVTWNVNFFADYQTAIAATVQHVGQTFQTRTDFGVLGKAISVQMFASTNSDILQLQGFTIESRFMRLQ